jgi:hypothetical protein
MENSTHTIVFSATARGTEPAATAATELRIGFLLNANPPRVDVPDLNHAATGGETTINIETFDPDGGATTVTLESGGGLDAEVRPTTDPSHFVLAVTPKANQAGQRFHLEVKATDDTGLSTNKMFMVDILASSNAQTVDLEIRWLSIDESDPFSEPQGVEIFEAPASSSQMVGDPGDFLGYAIYASTEEQFEPSDANLVAFANPNWRNTVVTFTIPEAKDGRKPVTVRVSGRRRNGTGRPSKETSTDLPRFPSRRCLPC